MPRAPSALAALLLLAVPGAAHAQVSSLEVLVEPKSIGRADCENGEAVVITVTAKNAAGELQSGLTAADWRVFVDSTANCTNDADEERSVKGGGPEASIGQYVFRTTADVVVDAAQGKASSGAGDCGGEDGYESSEAVLCVKYLGVSPVLLITQPLDIDTAGPKRPTLTKAASGDTVLHLAFEPGAGSGAVERWRSYYRVATDGEGGSGGAGGSGGQGGSGGAGGGGGAVTPAEDCDAAGDEDGDLLADCEDPDCTFLPGRCLEDCRNVDAASAPLDDDGDGLADCADNDCFGKAGPGGAACPGRACEAADCGLRQACEGADVCRACTREACGTAACVGARICVEDCARAGDEDGDGFSSCEDPLCAAGYASCEGGGGAGGAGGGGGSGSGGAGGAGGAGGTGGEDTSSVDLSLFRKGSEFSGASRHGPLQGLSNGTVYEVVIVAIDDEGNISPPSNSLFGEPREVDDFWDLYRKAGGAEDGGCSAAPGPLGLAGALLAAGWLLRRRREGKGT